MRVRSFCHLVSGVKKVDNSCCGDSAPAEWEGAMTKTFGRLSVLTAVFLVGINVVTPAQTNKVDVSGVWIFTVESPAGKSNPTLTFKQDGEKLTGQYSSQLMGQADLTGTIKGQAIEFVVSATVQGMPIELKYTGAVDTKDSMKGTLSAGDFGNGTFSGARKQN
jgi:hypothetical protein